MMKRLGLLGLGLLLAALPAAAQTVFISPDVPTDPGAGVDQLPWDVYSHAAGVYSAAPVLTVPGDPGVDALHKLDAPGNWLFSVEAPSDLGGALAGTALPQDVIRFDGVGYSFFFCGSTVVDPVPPGTNLDAVFTDASSGGDSGDLIVSFDVPTTIGSATFDPADLVRFEATVILPTCSDWKLSGVEFDASAAGVGIVTGTNLIGADQASGKTLMVLDIPSDLAPSLGPTTYLPGQIASWDGADFDLFDSLGGWPLASGVDGLTCQANPGRIPNTLMVDKSAITLGDLTLTWDPSCASGAEDYGIYEGTIGSYYSHTLKDCSDDLGDFTEEVSPAVASSYYLVVPHSSKDEGSYGARFEFAIFTERPQPALPGDRCVVTQQITACP